MFKTIGATLTAVIFATLAIIADDGMVMIAPIGGVTTQDAGATGISARGAA